MIEKHYKKYQSVNLQYISMLSSSKHFQLK